MKRQIIVWTISLLLTACYHSDNSSRGSKKSETLLANTYTDTTLKTIDTLVDVGKHKLHFKIIQGRGIPILFESGAGSDGSAWDTILNPIAEITGATLITYDRAGVGRSTIDTSETDSSKHGILSGLNDLEIALNKLGYDKQIMLISHSYGGYYTTLYASAHPNLVKSIVLIDVSHNFHERYVEKETREHEKETQDFKKSNLGFYYLAVTFPETIKLMRNYSIPTNIPTIDFVDGISFQENKEKTEHWKECHKQFVNNHPKCIGITANGCGHSIWMDNPSLIIISISKLYAEVSNEKQKINIYSRTLNYAINSSNSTKEEKRVKTH